MYDNNVFLNINTLGDNLASFIDAGNGVVFAMFDFLGGYSVDGRVANYSAILPKSPGGVSGTYSNWSTSSNSSRSMFFQWRKFKVLFVVESIDTDGSFRSGTWDPLAHQIAQWNDGTPLIGACTLLSGGRRVDLAFFPPSSQVRSNFWSIATDGLKIMVNAVNWASQQGQCKSLIMCLIWLGTGTDCLSCTKGGCQWCLDSNSCSPRNTTTCEDRITIPHNCPFSTLVSWINL